MEEMISKKDLLQVMGISYGQLYRWKRKKLIPEEWFVKKSSYTGQETYFPKDKILERVKKILELKEDISLDDLADKLSSIPKNERFTWEDIVKRNIVTNYTINLCKDINIKEPIDFYGLFIFYITDKFLVEGKINLQEGIDFMKLMTKIQLNLQNKSYRFILLRKMGVSFWLTKEDGTEIIVSDDVQNVVNETSNKYMEELKLKLSIL